MDLKERFVGAASSCAQVCKLLPRWISEKDAKEEDFDDLVQLCEGILPDGDFPSEFEVWKNMWRFPLYTDTPKTFTATVRVCHKATMPVIFTLLQIGATLPVTVSTAERSFSSMKLVKSYLHSNMKKSMSKRSSTDLPQKIEDSILFNFVHFLIVNKSLFSSKLF